MKSFFSSSRVVVATVVRQCLSATQQRIVRAFQLLQLRQVISCPPHKRMANQQSKSSKRRQGRASSSPQIQVCRCQGRGVARLSVRHPGRRDPTLA